MLKKVGVTGSEYLCDIIKKTLDHRMPELEVIYMKSNDYQYGLEAAARLQDMGVDGIIFTGPTNYNYAVKRLTPDVPWVYIPHNQSSIMKALTEAFVKYSCTPDVISVDMYEEDFVKSTMEEVGIKESRIIVASSSSSDKNDFQDIITKQHRYNYYHEGAKICFTNMGNTLEMLTVEGIPCVRISVTEEIIMDQIFHIQLQINAASEHSGNIAAVHIHLNYSFDHETDLSIREWEKIHYQNEMRELIYSVAHKLGAAAFSEGSDNFYIISDRQVLLHEFIEDGEYQKVISIGQKTPNTTVLIGIGYGSTPLEAKSRASMALNKSLAGPSDVYYIADNENHVTKMKKGTPVDHTEYFIQRLHVSNNTYARLKEVLSNHDNIMTSARLAEEMGITERSINRIILKLEQENCVTTVGKTSIGKGRPARIMKFTLP